MSYSLLNQISMGDQTADGSALSVCSPDGERHLVEVYLYLSPTDGALVVEVDTGVEETLPIRVHVNDHRVTTVAPQGVE